METFLDWRLYTDPSTETALLQTGIIRSPAGCRKISDGSMILDGNMTEIREVCQAWIEVSFFCFWKRDNWNHRVNRFSSFGIKYKILFKDIPTMDLVVFMLLSVTAFLFIFNFFWGTFSFCSECCCDRICMHVLPFTSGIGTITLSVAVIIFWLNFKTDGGNGIGKSSSPFLSYGFRIYIPDPKYISLHTSFFIVSSLIFPAVISVIIAIISSFFQKLFCMTKKEATDIAASNYATAENQQLQPWN